MRLSPRRVVLLLPLIFLIAAPPLTAQAWKALGPFGGSVQALAVAPSDSRVVYVTTLYDGAFRSRDGGASWVPMNKAFLTGQIAVDPVRQGWLYLSGPDGKLVKSRDFGVSWSPAGRGLEEGRVSAVAVDPARPSRVYAALGSRVFRSGNGGASWKPAGREMPVSSGSGATLLLAVAKPPGTVFALAEERLFRSSDAGAAWTALKGLPDGVLTVAASPSEPWVLYASVRRQGIFRSRDSGSSWELVRRIDSPVTSLAVSPRSARTVWAGTEDRGLLVSTDGGARWKTAKPQGISKITAVAAPSPRTVYAATTLQGRDPGGFFASEDGGVTWERRNRGLAGLEAPLLAVDPVSRGVLWTSLGSQGLYRSANGGRDWTLLTVPATSLALAPSAPSTLYATSPLRAWRTEDGGASWVEIAVSGDPPWPNGKLWVDPLSPATLWSNGNGFAKSVDGGATWVRQELPGPGNVRELAFAPSSPSTMYALGFRPATGLFTRVTAWRSTDGGATWMSIEPGLGGAEPTALAVDPVDPRLVYVAACGYYCSPAGGIWKSTDGGASWTLTGRDLGSFEVTALAASPAAGVVWAAVRDGGDGRIFRSTDSGETWQARPGPQARVIYQLILDPQDPRRVYAATSGGIWRMEDRSEDEP